ncbi:MAG TPA: UDP-N-acetylmuramate--L-alanine ligase [Acidimicrobiales bacterium]|nr:UDP-N-acetylmuramate--L-alanine ligase [Acidimicrobiales bacterium]
MRPDLSGERHIHVVGIGGAGMSAIATVLAAMGHRVSGSDLKTSPALERLRSLGLEVHVGHRADQVGGADLVAVSTAIPPTNPEVAEAGRRGLPVHSRADLLGAITALRRTIAVSGTHGKTTTSSILSLILVEAGWRPSFIVGGDVNEIGSGASWSDGEWLVVEADESDGTFLELSTEVALVTSVEPDHLEHYGSFDALRQAFARFLAGAPTGRVVCADDPEAALLGRAAGAVSYGRGEEADFLVTDVELGRSSSAFFLRSGDEVLVRARLSVPGAHNVLNAAAAATTALRLGVGPEAVAAALARFTGVARRFQFRGEAGGVTFIDDYAHLPGEVVPTLEAVANGGWSRIVCVFQPHRFSRTAALWRDFAGAFDLADLLVVTDVYPAGEAHRPGVSGKLIVDAVLDAEPAKAVAYLPNRAELVGYLRRSLRPGDVCLTLGAGDLTTLADELLEAG